MLSNKLTNAGPWHQNIHMCPVDSFLLCLSGVDQIDIAQSGPGNGLPAIFGMLRTAVFFLCGRIQGSFWRFTVIVLLVVYFSVTLHLKTFRLNDFIMSTGYLGNSCSPDRLSVFPSIYDGRTGLKGPCGFLSILAALVEIEGRLASARTEGRASTMTLKHLVLQ